MDKVTLNQFEEATLAAALLAERSLAEMILTLETETGVDSLDETAVVLVN